VAAEINLLTKNDLFIFWGGSNDMSKNNSQEGLKHLVNFMQSNNHTNIFLMCVPPRYYLLEWSCVNNEITVFNRILLKFMCTAAPFVLQSFPHQHQCCSGPYFRFSVFRFPVSTPFPWYTHKIWSVHTKHHGIPFTSSSYSGKVVALVQDKSGEV
jgi:hypothetical protein